MELELNKNSFLDDFAKVRSIENRKAKDRTAGFRYIHNATTKRLAEGEDFKVGDIDFRKFTYADMIEYIEYYENHLEPRIRAADNLFRILKKAQSVFSPDKRYY